MIGERLKLLDGYIKSGVSPILLENVPVSAINDAIVLEANCDVSLLNGRYEYMDYVPPKWYMDLLKQNNPILVINNINRIPLNEQLKFMEIFKYKKISTFELPSNCIILVTCSNLKENSIHEDVYSLMVHI